VKLPNDSIGVSDVMDWQECARRMSFKMRRHSGGEPPEAAVNPTTRYGTAVHDLIEMVEADDSLTDDQAIQALFKRHRWLQPEDIEMLHQDLVVYRSREPLGVRTVMSETEIRVPLFEHEGRMIYYRGRIDRLYQSLTDPSVYYHRDYKSTKWPRTQKEVDEDKQLWTYNWGLHEYLPEIGTLVQTYDQLLAGELETSKTDEEREQILEWLVMAVTAVLEDEEYGPDGLLVPSFNDWCAYCPIMRDCPVIPQLTNYALAEIAVLAPEVKNGRKSEIELDPDLLTVYVDQLERAGKAKGVLEKFEKAVKATLLKLPQHEREALGFTLRSKSFDAFSPESVKVAHQLLGDDAFYRLVSMSKQGLESAVGADKTKLELIIGMADKRKGAPYPVKKGAGRRRASRSKET
jgi:hypothetical protein